MSKVAGALGGQTAVIAGAVVVAAGAVGAYFFGVFDADTPTPEPVAVAQPVTPAPEPEAPKAQPAPPPKDDVQTEQPAAYAAPGFDVVRVEPDGSTLVAGSAIAGAKLDILLDAVVQTETDPGNDGKFAAFLTIEPSDQPRVLSLLMRINGQEISSDETVIIAPVVVAAAPAETPAETPAEEPVATPAPAPAPVQAVVADQDPKQQEPAQPDADEPEQPVQVAAAPKPATAPKETAPAADPTPETVAETPTPEAETPAPEPAKPAKPKAPAVILADRDGVKVIQPASAEEDPALQATVAIDAISYTDAGDVTIAGRGKPGQFVQIYLDNGSVGGTGIDGAGQWSTVLAAISPGIYTLRVDEVDSTGKVLSRIETPFKREAPAKVAKAKAQQPENKAVPPAVRVITVQPGSTLWAIAREKYGDGVMYVRVYEANKDRIRNPDLIYPGQVFVVPE